MWSNKLKCSYFSSSWAEKAKSDMYSVLKYVWGEYLIPWLVNIDSKVSFCVEQAFIITTYGFAHFK